MEICECPICEKEINLRGCDEDDVIECPRCGAELEVVSIDPPVVETPIENEDGDGWDDYDDFD